MRAGFYHRLRRHPRWAIGIATGVSVCLLVLTKLAIDWPVFPAKVPQEVQQAAQGKPDLVGSAYVYDFWGNFIDSEHLWRVKVNAEIVTAIAKECRRENWPQPTKFRVPSGTNRRTGGNRTEIDPAGIL